MPNGMIAALAGVSALLVFAGCAGSSAETDREVLVEACKTQKGAGWLIKEYGENYCACRADKAKEALDSNTYKTLVKASRAELKAANMAEREAIARGAFQAYAQAADVARLQCKEKR